MTRTSPTEPGFCPCCTKRLSAATSVQGDATPEPGDVTICFYCGTVLVFSDEIRPRLMTPAEFARLDEDTRRQIERAQQAIRIVHAD